MDLVTGTHTEQAADANELSIPGLGFEYVLHQHDDYVRRV